MKQNMPYIDERGDIVIPFDSPVRYHWWKDGGQSIEMTRAEVKRLKTEVEEPEFELELT